MVRNYYSLKEVLGVDTLVLSWTQIISGNKTFNDYITQIPADNEAKELFQKYICPRYLFEKICYLDNSDDVLEKALLFDRYRGYIFAWYNKTSNKYIKLIQLYKAQENNLLKQIESESFSRYNDTPQASNTGFDDDNYASNTNKVTTKTDAGTPIQRLEEVRRLLINVYNEWCNSFGKEFVIYE